MPDTQSRTQRFRGRSPPDRDDGWQVSTVSCRTTNHGRSEYSPVTETDVSIDESHFYVTLRRESEYRFNPAEYEYLVVADGALGELEEWLEDSEE
ncbi:hypothetical protein CP556_24805 [Natrinema sp. CBA1119]|uniref:hypothetical protein n=1 Tax=Natrinema sp. CBA1119 TaxID=1608465 RepID=UPI000BF7C0DA|nr:hypothetical protein [Natrinema sp. CBA1119]PGF14230.1 hypothetical protein CP556_24805 [Natrinema sp. CBA1119]